jgi:hypothetical protein
VFILLSSFLITGCADLKEFGNIAPNDVGGSDNESVDPGDDQVTTPSEPADPEGDDDLDGIKNGLDQCFVTPTDELIDDLGCSLSQLDSDEDGYKDDVDSCDSTPAGEIVDSRGCGTVSEAGVVSSGFIESGGQIVIEMESTDYSTGWVLETGHFASGNAYLMWQGGNRFGSPGQGIIHVPLTINTPGRYRFEWRSIVGEGDNPTESNDSWLKILADSFYGFKVKSGVDSVVCPKGKPASNSCVGENPEGASSDGWFKIYRSGGPVDEWKWMANTSDNDAHPVFAEFDTEGVYDLYISGRSEWHGIDRLILYRNGNASNNVSLNKQQKTDAPESQRDI